MSNKRKRRSSADGRQDRPSKNLRYEDDINVFSKIPSLVDLLDFSTLTRDSGITTRFNQLAEAILCEYDLLLENGDAQTEFEILELEFYLQKSGCHEDPFTHGADEQRYSGRWYVYSCLPLSHVPYVVSTDVPQIGHQVFPSRAHTFSASPHCRRRLPRGNS